MPTDNKSRQRGGGEHVFLCCGDVRWLGPPSYEIPLSAWHTYYIVLGVSEVKRGVTHLLERLPVNLLVKNEITIVGVVYFLKVRFFFFFVRCCYLQMIGLRFLNTARYLLAFAIPTHADASVVAGPLHQQQ